MPPPPSPSSPPPSASASSCSSSACFRRLAAPLRGLMPPVLNATPPAAAAVGTSSIGGGGASTSASCCCCCRPGAKGPEEARPRPRPRPCAAAAAAAAVSAAAAAAVCLAAPALPCSRSSCSWACLRCVNSCSSDPSRRSAMLAGLPSPSPSLPLPLVPPCPSLHSLSPPPAAMARHTSSSWLCRQAGKQVSEWVGRQAGRWAASTQLHSAAASRAHRCPDPANVMHTTCTVQRKGSTAVQHYRTPRSDRSTSLGGPPPLTPPPSPGNRRTGHPGAPCPAPSACCSAGT